MRGAVLKKSSLVLDEARLGLYFTGRLEIQSSGRMLDSYFIDRLAIQLSAKSKFISPYQQDILVLIDFLDCWQFGPV